MSDLPAKHKVYVYTDGSYSSQYAHRYAGAFLVYKGTQCIYKDSGCGTKAISMRNVAGELSAAMRAAYWLKKNNYKGVIVYDYEGVEKWLTGAWTARNQYTQAYVKFMKPYLKDGWISFKWVKAHNGDLGNHMADAQAKSALKAKKEWNL